MLIRTVLCLSAGVGIGELYGRAARPAAARREAQQEARDQMEQALGQNELRAERLQVFADSQTYT
jgi:hypothetical protein